MLSFLQSFGAATRLKCGAGRDSPIFHSLDYYSKELRVFTSALIQPVKRLPMFVAKLTCQPYNYIRIESSCIGKQLAEVVVVGGLELVLNDNRSVSVKVGSENVQRISAYVRFLLPQLQFHSERCP